MQEAQVRYLAEGLTRYMLRDSTRHSAKKREKKVFWIKGGVRFWCVQRPGGMGGGWGDGGEGEGARKEEGKGSGLARTEELQKLVVLLPRTDFLTFANKSQLKESLHVYVLCLNSFRVNHLQFPHLLKGPGESREKHAHFFMGSMGVGMGACLRVCVSGYPYPALPWNMSQRGTQSSSHLSLPTCF